MLTEAELAREAASTGFRWWAGRVPVQLRCPPSGGGTFSLMVEEGHAARDAGAARLDERFIGSGRGGSQAGDSWAPVDHST
jgi:hypothetical protein